MRTYSVMEGTMESSQNVSLKALSFWLSIPGSRVPLFHHSSGSADENNVFVGLKPQRRGGARHYTASAGLSGACPNVPEGSFETKDKGKLLCGRAHRGGRAWAALALVQGCIRGRSG